MTRPPRYPCLEPECDPQRGSDRHVDLRTTLRRAADPAQRSIVVSTPVGLRHLPRRWSGHTDEDDVAIAQCRVVVGEAQRARDKPLRKSSGITGSSMTASPALSRSSLPRSTSTDMVSIPAPPSNGGGQSNVAGADDTRPNPGRHAQSCSTARLTDRTCAVLSSSSPLSGRSPWGSPRWPAHSTRWRPKRGPHRPGGVGPNSRTDGVLVAVAT